MTAADLVVVLAAVLLSIGFAALIVVLLRVLDTLRALRSEVDDLRDETRMLIDDLRISADEARESVDEARHDLERFDRVLGSAEAIGDAVGSTVARSAFSSPAIKAAGLARGASRTMARLRRKPTGSSVIEVGRTPSDELPTPTGRKRA
ncbi:DUF948 domain-containing protein [Ilumatobacter sp.]|uniref:DUF948 domain-containing protein n=1 Tax=Ilumatobacter sp. TaxID=1967498 RepID=UPI003C53535D